MTKSNKSKEREEVKRMDGKSKDVVGERREILEKYFPGVFVDGVVDCNKLNDEVGNVMNGENGRYGLHWAGKPNVFKEIAQQTTKTLKPDKKESVDFESAQNIFIEGENLETLKVLQKSYYGKVKMIYIDPPYNTGNDFVYRDKFARSQEEEMTEAGEMDGDGNLQRDYKKNTKESGRFHSNWLNMMYPRLYLARNLLRDDGVIFVSIDDNEVHNLRMIMNEIFGEENFVATYLWHSTKSITNTALVSEAHTYNIVFAKNLSYYTENREEFRLPESGEGFSNPDDDPRGPWKADPFQVGGWRPNQQYEITNPNTGEVFTPNPGNSWKNDYDKFQELLEDNRIVFGVTGEAGPQRKRFLSEALKRGRVSDTWWGDVDTTTNATSNLREIFNGKKLFDNPKPVNLIKRMIQLASPNKNETILDFFAGSATTAHAVMAQNAEDEGNRKYILVQLPEKVEEDSEAYKAGYKTISEIGLARIKKAAEKIKKESSSAKAAEGEEKAKDLDLGVKVFRLDDSNFSLWRMEKVENEKELQAKMENVVENLKSKDENAVLYELILKSGYSPTAKIEKRENYFVVDKGELIISLAEKMTQKIVDDILAENPKVVICLDISFINNDELKTNTALQMKSKGVEFKVV